jgi:DNA-binding MarR family transcriptional regulator
MQIPPPEPAPGSNVLFDVWLVSRSVNGLLDSALADSGLSADEFAIYSVLRKGSLTPTQLAHWMSAPMTTVSSYIKRFESRGHLRREGNADDRRSYRVLLTEAGLAAHQRAGAMFLPVLGAVELSLGQATDAVRDSLSLLEVSLRQVAEPETP